MSERLTPNASHMFTRFGELQLLTKVFILGAAFAYPAAFAEYWYYSSSPPPRLGYIVDGLFWCSPFSVGLVLSTLPFGERQRRVTLSLVLLSALIHFVFQIPGHAGLTLCMVLADAFAAYRVIRWKRAVRS
jgi:hypothetical protein